MSNFTPYTPAPFFLDHNTGADLGRCGGYEASNVEIVRHAMRLARTTTGRVEIHIPATMGADLFALAGRTTIQYRADRYTSPDNHGWYYEIPDTSAGGIPSDDLIGPFPTEAAAVDAFLAKRPHAERQDTTTTLPYERRTFLIADETAADPSLPTLLVTWAELLEANDPETMQEIARLGVGERTVLGMSDPIVRTF